MKDDWFRVTPTNPPLGEEVLIWHEVFGVEVALRESGDSFFDRGGNELTLGAPVVWYMPLPGRPPGEDEPSPEAAREAASRREEGGGAV